MRIYNKFTKYLANVFYGADQLLNAMLAGDPNETMSSRMGKQIKAGKCLLCKAVCGVISVWWPDHCVNNIERVEQPGERDL